MTSKDTDKAAGTDFARALARDAFGRNYWDDRDALELARARQAAAQKKAAKKKTPKPR